MNCIEWLLYHLEYAWAILCTFFVVAFTSSLVRLSICLPMYRAQRPRDVKLGELQPMIVFGSGNCSVVNTMKERRSTFDAIDFLRYILIFLIFEMNNCLSRRTHNGDAHVD